MRRLVIIFLIGLAVYAAFAGRRLAIHTQDNHFVYLADAFLKGQTELVRAPHHGNDWASYIALQLKGKSADRHGAEVKGFFTRRKGKPNQFQTVRGETIQVPPGDRGTKKTHYFVSFPPGPAVLMMPWVAAVGYGANDVIFTVILAALNLVFFLLLLLRFRDAGYIKRTDREIYWFVLFFGFGTAHLWCAVLGQVWFTALIVGLTFHCLYLYFALDLRRPFLAGLFLSFAFATRASLVFAAAFFYWQLFVTQKNERSAGEKVRCFAIFSAPCLLVGLSLLLYNYIRFENALEFGHTYLAGGHIPRIRDFGLFHPHFLNRNLAAAFTLTPRLVDSAPYIQLTKHGMSIFLSTPALIWLFVARSDRKIRKLLWLVTGVISIPILFYQNTGWEQFSYRFILDVLPYLALILAASQIKLNRWLKGAILAGVLINALGAATFQRAHTVKLYGHFMAEEPRK